MLTIDKKILGGLISEKRKSIKMTQSKLSGLTGLSRNFIADIEAGRYMPSLPSAFNLAVALDQDLFILLKMSETHEGEEEV